MKSLNIYLTFDGNCREAMTFYQQCLGGELMLVPFEQMMPDAPAEKRGKMMHSALRHEAFTLMASDAMADGSVAGTNFSVNIDCASVEELERLFVALGAGGRVRQPPQDAPWGSRFGMLRDRFGVGWMFNHEYAQHGMSAERERAAAR